MKTHNRSNALLMELLIVILVFMLATALMVRFFAGVHALEERSRLTAMVLAEAQSQADRIYQAADPEETLREMGFTMDAEGIDWVYAGEDYISSVTLSREANGWNRQELTVRDVKGEVLLQLPCSRWQGVNP